MINVRHRDIKKDITCSCIFGHIYLCVRAHLRMHDGLRGRGWGGGWGSGWPRLGKNLENLTTPSTGKYGWEKELSFNASNGIRT